MRCIASIDIDCFYAQCEELRHPHLKGKPLGVQQKALVITSNYAARQFGIQKGDSEQACRRKCPEITILCGEDLTFYREVSQPPNKRLSQRKFTRRAAVRCRSEFSTLLRR